MNDNAPRRLGRSVWALLAGFLLVLVLTLVSDLVLYRVAGVAGPGQAMPTRFLGVAFTYRTVYAIVGSYLTARLAPYLPMAHALIGGVIGLLIGAAGALATWNKPFTQGAHWYPVALVLVALPTAWVGGRIFVARTPPAEA